MIFKQWRQVIGLEGPSKTQTRRPKFPYELAVQLWKHWNHWPEPPWSWLEWIRDFPVADGQLAEANRILAKNVVTLPVRPSRTERSVGRVRVKKIRQEPLGWIGPRDIGAEGIEPIRITPNRFMAEVRLEDFAELWDSIYGEGAWDRMAEDDVYVLEFEHWTE